MPQEKTWRNPRPVAGVSSLSCIDYPGKVAALVFTQGCNAFCMYCHNKELVKITEGKFTWDEAFSQIESNAKRVLLDGVVITGGEPTMHDDLPYFARKVKNLGLAVKLDTNGLNPGMLRKLLREKDVDYVAMDLKTVPRNYAVLTQESGEENIMASLAVLKDSGVQYEVRTTISPMYLGKAALQDMNSLLEEHAAPWLCQYDTNLTPEKKAWCEALVLDMQQEGARLQIR